MSVWKVLAPIDLAAASDASVQQAIDVAKTLAADLVLLHVVDTHAPRPGPRLHWPSRALEERGGPEIHRLILPGTVEEVVTRYANFIDAELVLLPALRYGRWNRFWRKSATADLMRSSNRPMLVTKSTDSGVDGGFKCRRMLCYAQLDGHDAAVLEQARRMASRSGAEIVLAHVVPEASEGLLAHAVEGASPRPLSRELASEKLLRLSGSLPFPARTSVMVGSPEKCIGLAAREYAADLVLVARGGPSLDRRFVLDSEAVFSRLPCPMLSVSLDASPRQRIAPVRELGSPVRSWRHEGSRAFSGSALVESERN